MAEPEETHGPLIEVGSPVSAKYRGAWCEGKVKSANYNVQYRVFFTGEPSKHFTIDGNPKSNLNAGVSCSRYLPPLH